MELARTTAAEDDKIDKLFYQTWVELIGMMVEDPTMINNVSHLLFMLRYLERIGDYASNICESVVYMVTAERVELNSVFGLEECFLRRGSDRNVRWIQGFV